MMFRCTRCLYPSTKPDLHFNDKGVCSACQAFDKRNEIDWASRHEQFMELVAQNRGKSHDVIVACSGGKDSTAQVVKCLELGLRPLAVTATTDHLSKLGRRNLDNISNLCDHIEVTPHKPTRRKISRFALDELGDISWCEHQLIWSVPAREAAQRGIPIVLYGEAQNNEYGAGSPGTENTTRLDKAWIDEYGGLLGLRLSDVAEALRLDEHHLEIYRYPEGANVQAVFMGAYFPWDGYENFKTAAANGFQPFEGQHIEGSLYNYENLDNLDTGLHDYVRFLKHGYGRAVDIASSHIRRGRLSRNEAIDLIKGRDGAYPHTYLGEPIWKVLYEIGMLETEFKAICERFTNHDVVKWASSPESFRSFFTEAPAASKDEASIRSAA